MQYQRRLAKRACGEVYHVKEDRLFYCIVDVIVCLILIIILYPLIFIVSSSFSSTEAVISGRVLLFPVDFSLEGYKAVFKTNDVLIGYRNSLFYTVVGTFINVSMTMMAAYPLSRKDMEGRNLLMMIFAFTMIFNGGMIPTYMLIRSLKMLNTPWALLIPGAISVYNLIITRTYIQTSIPGELLEASKIDGCSDSKYLLKIVLPLSKPVIAVITLYYAIGHWNAYFNAFLYITNEKLFPLQLVLRNILLANQIDGSMVTDPELLRVKQGLADLLRYSLIVVSSVPVLIIYPFIQKHFVKGVMIGSIKG